MKNVTCYSYLLHFFQKLSARVLECQKLKMVATFDDDHHSEKGNA